MSRGAGRRGEKGGAHSTTSTYTAGKDSPAREPSWSAFWLQKPSILRVCVREEGAGEREAGAPSDLKTYSSLLKCVFGGKNSGQDLVFVLCGKKEGDGREGGWKKG